ncbi:MAG: glycosyltransferase family 1 protein [Gemmataceae bacterium]
MSNVGLHPRPQLSKPTLPIDTLWVDVSVVLLIPGYISGITRTVRKIVECWAKAPWMKIRYCAVVPEMGIMEVNPHSVFRQEASSSTAEPAKSSSRFWYLPWKLRHNLRTYWKDPVSESPSAAQTHQNVPYYPAGSVIGPANLGSRDLLFSLGGLWVVPEIIKTFKKAHEQHDFQFVSLIYDLIPLVTPQFCSPSHVIDTFVPTTNLQLQSSNVILTISDYSKRDIEDYAKKNLLPIGPVEVFTLGSNISPHSNSDAVSQRQPVRPFVLSVGTIEVRKNHSGMYQAWRKLVKTMGPDKTPDLVFAGKPGWHGEQITYLCQNDPLVKDKIIIKSHIGDRELDWLYRNCLFTLYPSLYEGWGLPVEESFIYGKLCVTTNATSLPEVGREFATYIEPEDTDAIVKGVQLALDESYRRERERIIRERYRPNTWEQAAQQLQTILQSHYTFPVPSVKGKRKAA